MSKGFIFDCEACGREIRGLMETCPYCGYYLVGDEFSFEPEVSDLKSDMLLAASGPWDGMVRGVNG